MDKKQEVENLLQNYELDGSVVNIEPFGNGRINKTFKVTTLNGGYHNYILQQINTGLFKNVDGLMENIDNITSHIRTKIRERGGNETRETLTIIKTKNGDKFVSQSGCCFRIYEFIENIDCKEMITCQKDMEQLGKIVGKFHNDLSDFDATVLNTTIPDFHNTKKRFLDFFKVFSVNPIDRNKNAKDEIDFVFEEQAIASKVYFAEQSKILPIRTVHNDTKLNNVMFDRETGKALAMLDLDTVMPNTLLYDFGDAIRYACNTANEDELDLSKVDFNIEYFKAFTSAYIKETKKMLTDGEKELLYLAPKTLSYELGLRFLTDYLSGDHYFPIKNENDNLNRAKVQLALTKKIISNEKIIKEFIEKQFESTSKTIKEKSKSQTFKRD